MTALWLWLLLMACVGLAAQGLRTSVRAYEPFLPMSAVFFGFAWLQLHGLWRNEHLLPVGALERVAFMTLLCLVGFWWGYSRKVRPLKFLDGVYNERRLLGASVLLSAIGGGFFFAISRLPEDVLSNSLPSGLLVAYRFFALALSYGFALAWLLWARFGSRSALSVACFGAAFYFDRIIIAGRRAEASEFFFIAILALLFGRGRKLSRIGILASMVIMVVAMHSTGQYRTLARESGWRETLMTGSIDFFANLRSIALYGGEEMKNAVYVMDAYSETGEFDFGLSHWNLLVFNYVPAQIVGASFKSSLKVDLPDVAASVYGYQASTGSTLTGMVDSFGSFWYFGALNFAVIGAILRKIWRSAWSGSLGSQLLYMLLITNALHTVTHHTNRFFSPWIHMSMFLFPLLLWARRVPPTPPVGSASAVRPGGVR